MFKVVTSRKVVGGFHPNRHLPSAKAVRVACDVTESGGGLFRIRLLPLLADVTSVDSLRDYQQNDDYCQSILCNPEDYTDYPIVNNFIMTKEKDPKCYVPVAARLQAMRLYHDKSSHIGWDKCIAKMREDLYWPKMGRCLKKFIRNCRACVVGKSHTGRRAGLWQMGEKPEDILDTWHIDHAGPLVKSQGCTQLLVVVDAFSKYCNLCPIPRKTTEDTIKALLPLFKVFGKPRRIIADRAAAFTSITFQNFLSEQGVQLHHIATGMPRGNGQVERIMRTVFNLLRATLTDEKETNWISAVADIERNMNSTINKTTRLAPSVLQLGKNLKLSATQQFLVDVPSSQIVPDLDNAILETQKRIADSAKQQAKEFNLKRYAPTLFSVGEVVALEDSQHASGGKLKPKYGGPYTIRHILPNDRYLLSKKGKRTTVAAHEQLRRWPSAQTA